jgi:quercetin dioxygenase-like cupin family protein
VNDFAVRLGLFFGEYDWHKHTSEDELFYVYKGKITLEIESQPSLSLSEGQLAMVPRGVKHRPVAPQPAYVLMLEPYLLKSKGD